MNKLIHKIYFSKINGISMKLLRYMIKSDFSVFFSQKNKYNILDALDTSLFAGVVVIVAVVRLLLDAYDH